ncbi:MAG: F0F1 ATP synthase subunit A [Phycisphaerae bacterium]|nr:F0F1 ATP synthase subunit A [Phycisphaerae bacterium]
MTTVCTMLAAANPVEHVISHELFEIGPVAFTNHMFMMLITAVIMLVIFPRMARDYPLVPTGFRNLFETSLEWVREGVARPLLHDHTDRFLPFIWTLFFFLLINNLLGLIPLSAIGGLATGNSHLFGTATANISVTAALAAVSFVVTHAAGLMEQYRHLRHDGRPGGTAAALAPVKYLYSMVPHIPGILGMVMFPVFFILEVIVAPLVRPFALCMRLFANMMGGHVLLAAILMMIPAIKGVADGGLAIVGIAACTALNCLELLVAVLQAYIFTFLTCMFIGSAVSPEH